MNNLSKKYNIPSETLKSMVKDGVISCSWVRWEEVYDSYKKNYSVTGKKTEAVSITAIEKNISDRVIYRIIHYIEG